MYERSSTYFEDCDEHFQKKDSESMMKLLQYVNGQVRERSTTFSNIPRKQLAIVANEISQMNRDTRDNRYSLLGAIKFRKRKF